LTRVTRIFQKRVLTKIAPAGKSGTPLVGLLLPTRERRRADVCNATGSCREQPLGRFHCFRIVIYNGWRNARV
jgi:hypothetical protein